MLFASLDDAYFRVNSEGDPVDVKGRKITRVGRRLVVNYKNRYDLTIKTLDHAATLLTTIMTGGIYALSRMHEVVIGFGIVALGLITVRVFLAHYGRIDIKPSNIISDKISLLDYQLKRIALKIIFSDLGSIKNIIWILVGSAFILAMGWVLHSNESTLLVILGITGLFLGATFLALGIYMLIVTLYSKIYYRNKPNLPEAFVWNWQKKVLEDVKGGNA